MAHAVPVVGSIWRHKRRGTAYTVVAIAVMQTHNPEEDSLPCVVYGRVGELGLCTRMASEFMDGRFTPESLVHSTMWSSPYDAPPTEHAPPVHDSFAARLASLAPSAGPRPAVRTADVASIAAHRDTQTMALLEARAEMLKCIGLLRADMTANPALLEASLALILDSLVGTEATIVTVLDAAG